MNADLLDGALTAWYAAIAEFVRRQGGIFRPVGHHHFQVVSRSLIAELNGIFVKSSRSNFDLISVLAQSQSDFGFPWSIQVREGAPSRQLVDLATARGLGRSIRRPLLVAPLDGPAPALAPPRGFRLRVATDGDMEAYLAALSSAFSAPPHVMAIFGSDFGLRGATVYVIEDGARIVATGLVVLVDRWAAIFNVATIPECRGRGLATSLLQRMLRDAYETGAHHAVLQSSEAGLRLYRANGFTIAERWSVFASDI